MRGHSSQNPVERLGYKKKAFHQLQRHAFYTGLKWKQLM